MGLILGAVLFLCTILAYTIGLKHGRELSKGNTPKLNLNPIKPIVNAIEKHEDKKKVEALTDELEEVMNYSRESALKAVKEER